MKKLPETVAIYKRAFQHELAQVLQSGRLPAISDFESYEHIISELSKLLGEGIVPPLMEYEQERVDELSNGKLNSTVIGMYNSILNSPNYEKAVEKGIDIRYGTDEYYGGISSYLYNKLYVDVVNTYVVMPELRGSILTMPGGNAPQVLEFISKLSEEQQASVNRWVAIFNKFVADYGNKYTSNQLNSLAVHIYTKYGYVGNAEEALSKDYAGYVAKFFGEDKKPKNPLNVDMEGFIEYIVKKRRRGKRAGEEHHQRTLWMINTALQYQQRGIFKHIQVKNGMVGQIAMIYVKMGDEELYMSSDILYSKTQKKILYEVRSGDSLSLYEEYINNSKLPAEYKREIIEIVFGRRK